jgi:hypothetical protein
MMFSNRLLLSLLALPLFAGGCKTEEDPRIFAEEDSVYSLQRFALDGINWIDVDQSSRKDAFMIQFDSQAGEGVVSVASCVGGGTADVQSSLCAQSFEFWECRCFAYIHQEANKMEWQEFAVGEQAPPVVSETGEDGLEDEGADTEGDPSDTINVALDPEINGAILFEPLPGTTNVYEDKGVFNSDGTTSRHQMLKRSNTIFADTMCADMCG